MLEEIQWVDLIMVRNIGTMVVPTSLTTEDLIKNIKEKTEITGFDNFLSDPYSMDYQSTYVAAKI